MVSNPSRPDLSVFQNVFFKGKGGQQEKLLQSKQVVIKYLHTFNFFVNG